MSVEFYRGSPGKFDPRTLNRETVSRWTGRTADVHLDAEIRTRTTLNSDISTLTYLDLTLK